MISLNRMLDEAKNQFIANTPIEVHMEMFRMIRELQLSGQVNGLPEGSKAKDFKLKNAQGEEISLYKELTKGPVVLTFYRGGWCPFCSMQLRAYQGIMPEIQAIGAQLIAVSPQSPDNTLSQQEKESLTYQVLSDTEGLAAAQYNILYDVPSYIQEVMQNRFGLNLAEYNASDRWVLPVPATFMIDERAVIRSSYVNPDYMKRLEPQEILDELRKL